MSDEPTGRAPAATTLRDYLADRDVPCHQCGYNLRGTLDVFCPECGTVIQRPPSEHIARAAMDPAELKLWCPECDYVVTGLNARCCPECGSENLARFVGEKPPPRRRRLFRPQGVPIPLWINTLFGLVTLPLAVARVCIKPYASQGLPAALEAGIGGVAALTPGLITALWMWQRRAIRGMTPAQRLAAAGFAFLFGLLAWLTAIAFLR